MSSLAPLEWMLSRGTAYDLPEVMVVMKQAFLPAFGEAWTAAQCSGILGMPGTELLIARVDDSPAGFTLTRSILDEAELLLLAVHPGYARHGIGRGLLLSAMDAARDLGVSTMNLEVRSDNPAVALYESVGFVQVGIRRGYYRGNDGRVRDALTYRRLLDIDARTAEVR